MVLTLAFMALVALFAQMAPAATNYVAQGGQTPASPYTSWETAASNIQDAINQATAGDSVLVSNGVYQTGGVTNFPAGTLLTNRIAINKAITVRSANNNPTNTIIKGAWDPATNGPAAIRCVYMTNGSTLIGFTLTNGATLTTGTDDRYGGGVYCPSLNTVISNCIITGNSATNRGGGAYYGTLFNCTLSGNSVISPACFGGGAYASTMDNCTLRNNLITVLVGNEVGGGVAYGSLTNCTLIGNSAGNGGGAYISTLFNCTVISNRAGNGGGASGSTLQNCTLSGNWGWTGGEGGGARASTLYNCTLTGNSNDVGGGAFNSTLYNCVLAGNSAGTYGGGAYNATILYNCTFVGNSASYGGGVAWGTLINCIVYFNQATTSGSNWYSAAVFTNSCTAPAASGPGNITSDPMLIDKGSGYGTNHVAGNYRLSANSPPLNAGTNFSWMTDPADVRSRDLDGQPRIRYGMVDMGAYETLLKGTVFSIH